MRVSFSGFLSRPRTRKPGKSAGDTASDQGSMPGPSDQGSMMLALLVAMVMAAMLAVFLASVVATVHRSVRLENSAFLAQYTKVAVDQALAALNSGNLPDGDETCERVDDRTVCWRSDLAPEPAEATLEQALRFELSTDVWLDVDDDTATMEDEASTTTVVEAVNCGKNDAAADSDGKCWATPATLFQNAVYSFSSTTIAGPDARFRSYNSAHNGQSSTGSASIASSGWVAYGDEARSDGTRLYNSSGTEAQRSRCTGAACETGDVRLFDVAYQRPDDDSLSWLRDPALCEGEPFQGDWVTSEHGGMLPKHRTCIHGSLVVDSPASRLDEVRTALIVSGNVHIGAEMNASDLPSPADLVVYSLGAAVSFDAPHRAEISALIYAPLATCGNNPGAGTRTIFYGSLVCDTVSLGGPWDHMSDEATTLGFEDPAALQPTRFYTAAR